MSKAVKDHRDWHLTILDWRNTPTPGSHYSPVQKLHSRRPQTLLPTSEVLLLPAVAMNVVDKIELKRQKAKVHYDRGAKPLPDLQTGQTVNLQPVDRGNTWKTATTLSKLGNHSYMLQTDEGNLYRGNRKFIRSTPVVTGSSTAGQQGVDNSTPETSDSCSTDTSPEPSKVPDQELKQSCEDSDIQNANTSHSSTMFTCTSKGRTIKLQTRLKDYVRH